MDKENRSRGFGNRIREERVRLSYTQEKLAESLNIRQQTVYKWEKGITFPDVDFLYLLQDLGFDVGYLIFGVMNVSQIQNVPTDILIKITTMVKELEKKFGAGTLSDQQRLQISLVYVGYYLQNPSSADLTSVTALELLLNRGV